MAVALALAGCQRGCLTDWLTNRGILDDPKNPPSGGSMALQEVDCPDGLARCVNGVVETSLSARRPSPCKGSPEECDCPWTKGPRCASGCVVDGVEIEVPADRAPAQVCAPSGDAPAYARPNVPGTPPPLGAPCGEDRFRCIAGAVLGCSPAPARAVAECIQGCVLEGEELDDDEVDDRAAAALLCAR